MEYLDDIDIKEFKEVPTYKRMCICIMKNDHLCKTMGFSLTKTETQKRKQAESKYKKIFAFVTIHRKRKCEKFVIPTENSMSITPNVKSFVFLSSRNRVTRDNQLLQSNEMHVQNVPPLIAYMFGVAVFLLLPEILSRIMM